MAADDLERFSGTPAIKKRKSNITLTPVLKLQSVTKHALQLVQMILRAMLTGVCIDLQKKPLVICYKCKTYW
jgi:hypothetical protein